MSTRRTLSTLTTTMVAGAALIAAQDAAAVSGTFSCSASAVSGTVLGQPITPVAAAGGDGPCRTADGGSGLFAPVGGQAIARTLLSGDGAGQRATSTAGVGGLDVGGLQSLVSSLPVPALPAGLNRLSVPLPVVPVPVVPSVPVVGGTLPSVPAVPGLPTLPGTPAGSLLPTSIVVDAVDAVRALVPSQALPFLDLVSVDNLVSTATAACEAGKPVLRGLSDVTGLQALGKDLPLAGVVDKAVGLTDARSIPVSGVDLSLVKLPAGLSFDDPVVGAVLRQAVSSALAGLPPITIPAVVGDVTVTPGSTDGNGTTLVQRGPRVQVRVLGRDVADVTLGSARVSALGVDCSAPATPVAVPDGVAPASRLAIECAKRRVTLIDVAQRRDKVSLLGAAAADEVGEKVSIVYAPTGKVVATTTVRPSGFFRASAPLPPKADRADNDTRYLAVLDGEKSMKLKLQRRMRISRLNNLGDKIQLVGKITGPLVPGQRIVVRKRESCTKDTVVKTFMPTRPGTFRITLPAPEEGQAAVYRATTMVFGTEAGKSAKTFPTFSLPGYVSL